MRNRNVSSNSNALQVYRYYNIQSLFMKFLLLILLLISNISFCQTVHGIKSGLDSIAFVNKVRSRTVTTIKVDSTSRDSLWTKRYEYLRNGYINIFEETDLKNLDTSTIWNLGYHYIKFTYNEKGFLIDTDVKWDGPVNVPATPDSTQIITKRIFKNEKLHQEIVIQTTWYDEYDSFTDSTITTFNSDGSTAEVYSPLYYRETYFYNSNGLLDRIEYTNAVGLFNLKVIEYEFFE